MTTKKKKTPAPAPVAAKAPAERRTKDRRRPRLAVGLDANTAAVIAGSLSQALGSVSIAPGARLAINIGPHGTHVDYIKPPAAGGAPSPEALAEAYMRGFDSALHTNKPVAEFTPPEAPAARA